MELCCTQVRLLLLHHSRALSMYHIKRMFVSDAHYSVMADAHLSGAGSLLESCVRTGSHE